MNHADKNSLDTEGELNSTDSLTPNLLCNAKLKIAIYGGAFDPPHIGHLSILNRVAELGEIKKIYLIPSSSSRGDKMYHFSDKIRLELVRKMVEKSSKLAQSKLEISDLELNLTKNEVLSSYITDCQLKKLHPHTGLVWVIGSDILDTLANWRFVDKVRDEMSFLVVNRVSESEVLNLKKVSIIAIEEKIAKKIEQLLKLGYKVSHLTKFFPPTKSSSFIRKSLQTEQF
jgi:nicotinate-nucleotide adenylyltransferase